MNYITRSAETKAKTYLENNRALFILGARQVGKTTLMKRMMEIVGDERALYFDLENPEHLSALSKNVNDALSYIQLNQPLFQGRIYIFIDEIQYMDDFSHTIKYLVDHYADKYKLIMTGSSSLQIKKSFTESLVGRKDVLELYPLSFSEFCRFRGEERIAGQIATLSPDLYHTLAIPADKLKRMISEYSSYGAYPRVVLSESRNEKIELLRDIVNSYILKDVKHLFKIEKLDQFNLLLRYLAINQGKEINIQGVSKSIGLYWDTVQKHVQALRESYIIAVLKPFYRNLTTEIRKMPKVYFIDSGTRNAVLNNFNPLDIRPDRGEIFEGFVYMQLFYLQDIMGEVRFWKTRSGQEIDFVVLNEDSINAYEVKYGDSTKNHFQAFMKAYPNAKCAYIRYEGNGNLLS